MLALVTCHIFPPSIWYGKNEFLAPDFPADSSQFFRVHGFTSAVRQMPTAMRNPFAWTNVSSGKNACFAIWPHVGTKFFNLSQHFLSMDGWPGDAIFFLWGQPFKIIHENSAKKRSSPLDFIFDTCASASSSHLFLVGEAEHMWLYPFCKDKCIFRKKNACFAIWARWHKILEFVPSCPICGWLAWRCDFFPMGQPLKIIRKYSVKKRSSPLDFIFDTCASASSSHFFGWWSWTCVSVPFCKDNCIFSKKTCVLQFGRALAQNSWIRPIMSYQWMIGLVMRLFSCGPTFEDHPQVFSQKRSSPLDFIFDPCAFASWSHFFGWWRWTYVVVPLLQSHLKNHTHSINHGTFFPGVWHLDMF